MLTTLLKKIGLTALAGSLAAVSANAGEMSVSGAFNATYSTSSGNVGTLTTDYGANGDTPDHGSGLGTDKDVAFSGSGELDNGWTFSGYTTLKDAMTVSSSALSMTMGSMGTLSIASQSGGNSTKYDVQTPKAYEEVDDGAAVSMSANFVGNHLDNNSLIYASPAVDLGGVSAVVHVEYSPEASGTSPNDGGTVSSATWGSAKSLGVTLSGSGLTFGIYGADRENDSAAVDGMDGFSGVWYANYSYGPVSVGVSQSYYDSGLASGATASTAAKTVGVATGIFESETMSIAFNVNDNLSVSFASATDTYDAQDDGGAGVSSVADVDMDLKSIQAAYSMGAMSIKAYRTETDNAEWATSVGDEGGSLTVTEIAVGLAF